MLGFKQSQPLDFPFQPDAGILQHPRAHGFTQVFELIARSRAGVDHEIAVHRRHLRPAHGQAAAARLIDHLPGRMAFRVLEGRAAGLLADRLNRFAVMLHGVHGLADLVLVGGHASKMARVKIRSLGPDECR
jgi:hypothetical protein